MKIAVFANTPAQLHFYIKTIEKLRAHGHEVRLLLRDYGETIDLANELHLAYFVYSRTAASKMSKIVLLPRDVVVAYRHLRKFRPDVVTGCGVYDAFTAALLNAYSIEFEDSEPRVNLLSYSIQLKVSMSLVDAVVTPSSFMDNLGEKQIRISSFKELAYLHPNYYIPNDDIFGLLGVRRNDDYVLLRFNAFDAVHDFRVTGFRPEDKIRLVRELEKYAKVFISSEADLPDEIEDRVVKIPKSRIHDVIYYAKMLVTDTQTMATEAAVLGTPTVRFNSFVGENDMGNFIELERKYGLIFNYNDSNKAIERAIQLVAQPNLKKEWLAKRDNMLRDKTDATEFMVSFIEEFPESYASMKAGQQRVG